jgi:hypothetical protein
MFIVPQALGEPDFVAVLVAVLVSLQAPSANAAIRERAVQRSVLPEVILVGDTFFQPPRVFHDGPARNRRRPEELPSRNDDL